jgi:hypothetical protein
LSSIYCSRFVLTCSRSKTKFYAGDLKARLALENGDVHPRNIPNELRTDEQSEAGARWLAEHCSEKRKKAHERRLAELGSIKLSD